MKTKNNIESCKATVEIGKGRMKDGHSLTLRLYLSEEQKEKLLLENGMQPKGIFGVCVL